ncbi:uncharacterized protein [Chironomus tepperi]|uniref:uncharacterized protein n=1 Tax=Chironomus tepperi TaxID=113505 RepID=UPI00391FC115
MSKILFIFTSIIWIASLTESTIVDCDWNGEICNRFVSITPVVQPNDVVSVSGKPAGYINTATTILGISDFVLNYIPPSLFTVFPKLSDFFIQKCSMTNLITDNFVNCADLQSLALEGGNFAIIPAGFAQTCTKILNLRMANNNILSFDVNAFQGLTGVRDLDLTYNNITCIPADLFQPLISVVTIHLEYNKITAIDSSTFRNLPKLMHANLKFNLLSYLPTLDVNGSSTQYPFTHCFENNPIYAVSPDFISTIVKRNFGPSDCFMMGGDLCSTTSKLYPIQTFDYQTSGLNLVNCYGNWTSSMNAPVTCAAQPTTTLAPTTAVVTTPSPTPGSCPSDKICRYFLDQYNRYTCVLDGVDSVLTSISGNHLITFADVNVRRVIFTNSFLSRIPPILFQKFTSLEYLTVFQ